MLLSSDDLISNDLDFDLDLLLVESVGNANHGTVELVDDNIVFNPDSGYVGADRCRLDGIKCRKGRGAIAPGLGPSMRFRVKTPGVYRLEARNARKRVVRPLLRRASN